jgi:hypothetical protein
MEGDSTNLDGTATSHNRVVLHGTADNHDGVVDGSLTLLNELLSTTAKDDGARLGLGASSEEVVSEDDET